MGLFGISWIFSEFLGTIGILGIPFNACRKTAVGLHCKLVLVMPCEHNKCTLPVITEICKAVGLGQSESSQDQLLLDFTFHKTRSTPTLTGGW